jgi:hypothetical protein
MTLAQLRDQLAARFSKEELRNLCFDLAINPELLPDTTIYSMARELVAYCERNERLSDLIGRCRALRPQATWTEPTLPEQKGGTTDTDANKKRKQPAEGDVYRVKMGNVGNQAQVAVGRNIQQSQTTGSPVPDLLADVLTAIRTDLVGEERQAAEETVEALQAELQAAEPDINKLVTLKDRLIALGGQVATATQQLFANEQVQAFVKTAAEIALSATLKRLTGM